MTVCTAAFIAAVFLDSSFVRARTLEPVGGFLPAYSKAVDKTLKDGDIEVEAKGRRVTVRRDGQLLWELPHKVLSQDILLDDIDRDGQNELVILCWRRGKFGRRRPRWVKVNDMTWSQHIFIYETDKDGVVPKWMASDIGVSVASFDSTDGVICITDTEGNETEWKWASWGLEKI